MSGLTWESHRMWESKRSRFKKPDQDYYSIANKLKSENKIDERFEIMLSSLTLEEIIGLRLELAAQAVNYKLYGLNIWHSVQDVVRDGVLKYAYSAGRTKAEIAAFLGIDRNTLKKLLKKYDITNYFSKEGTFS
jgi:DNA-binding protein Fis